MFSFLSTKKHKKSGSDAASDDYKSDHHKPVQHNASNQFNFIHIESIDDLYTYQSEIGLGSSCDVYLVQNKKTLKQYALKRMPRSDKLNSFSFVNEIKVLQALDHQNIVYLNEAYISNRYYFVTTEYCSGGTLNERIIKMKRFSERDCVAFMKKILDAIGYIHSKHIVHRDLKLSNIVFDTPDIKQSKLKIIDFGESEYIIDPQKEDRNMTGSIYFLPPESNQSRRKKDLYAGDMWAVGVIAYTLIEGAFPYKPKSIRVIRELIDKNPLKWNDNIPITALCKNFIQSLLHKDIHKRLTAQEALQHQWITNQATDVNLGDAYFARLQCLRFQNKLQKVMVKAVLHDMSEKDKKSVLSHDGYEDDTQLINTILASSSASLNDLKATTKDSKCYKHTADISDASIDWMEIDDMLAEIDVESNMCCDDINTTSSMVMMAPMQTMRPQTPEVDYVVPTEQFVTILQSSAKQYDITAIVRQITDDGCGPITYRKIAAHHETMDTIEDIDDWVQ